MLRLSHRELPAGKRRCGGGAFITYVYCRFSAARHLIQSVLSPSAFSGRGYFILQPFDPIGDSFGCLNLGGGFQQVPG